MQLVSLSMHHLQTVASGQVTFCHGLCFAQMSLRIAGTDLLHLNTSRFGSTFKVLAKRMLKYCRISWSSGAHSAAMQINFHGFICLNAQGRREEDAECPVCQEVMAAGSSITKLPCQHTFHAACAHQWLSRRPTCPTYVHLIPPPIVLMPDFVIGHMSQAASALNAACKLSRRGHPVHLDADICLPAAPSGRQETLLQCLANPYRGAFL